MASNRTATRYLVYSRIEATDGKLKEAGEKRPKKSISTAEVQLMSPPKKVKHNHSAAADIMQACNQGDVENLRHLLSRTCEKITGEQLCNTPAYQTQDTAELPQRTGSWSSLVNTEPSGVDSRFQHFLEEIDRADESGQTALSIADNRGFAEITHLLLTLGQPNKMPKSVYNAVRGHFGQKRALHLACSSFRTVEHLCKYNANPNGRDIHGNTPLHCVTHGDQLSEIVQLLVKSGADIDARNAEGCTPLHHACVRLAIPVINALLENGATVNVRDNYGATPLHYLALYQQVPPLDVVKQLRLRIPGRSGKARRRAELQAFCSVVVRGLNDRTVDADQRRHLRYLLMFLDTALNMDQLPDPDGTSHVNAVEQLLSLGADVNAKDKFNRTALHIAVSIGYRAIVQCLISNEADIDCLDVCNTTVLHEAGRFGHPEVLQMLIELHGAKSSQYQQLDFVNAKDSFPGETAMHRAAVGGYRYLVPDQFDNCDPRYGPDFSPHEGHRDVIRALAAQGASVNSTDSAGNTPLHLSVVKNSVDNARLLLQLGADVNACNTLGNTALHMANEVRFSLCGTTDSLECVRHRTMEIVSLLLEHGGDVNARNIMERTPLHIATASNLCENVQLLVRGGADVNVRDVYGNTPILRVQYEGDDSVTAAHVMSNLIEASASVNDANNLMITPLHMACCKQNLPLAEILVKHGADCNAREKQGATPLHYLFLNKVEFLHDQDAFIKLLLGDIKSKESPSDCSIRTRAARKTPLHFTCERKLQPEFNITSALIRKTNLRLLDISGNQPFYGIHIQAFAICTSEHCYQWCHKKNKRGISSYVTRAKVGIINAEQCDLGNGDRDSFGRNAMHLAVCSRPLLKEFSKWPDSYFSSLAGQTDFLKRNAMHHLCIISMFCHKMNESLINSRLLMEIGDLEGFLSKFNALVNEQDAFGRAPLHYAVLNQSDEFIRQLIQVTAANPTIADSDGILPGDIGLALKKNNLSDLLPCSPCTADRVKIVVHESERQEVARDTSCLEFCSSWIDEVISSMLDPRNVEFESFIRSHVTRFVEAVCEKVGKLRPLFSATCQLVGSSKENIRLRMPFEYDFLMQFPGIQQNVKARESSLFAGFVQFVQSEEADKKDAFLSNLFELDVLQPRIVKQTMYELLIRATSQSDIWENSIFEYLKLKITNSPSSPAVTIELALNRSVLCNELHLFSPEFQECNSVDLYLHESERVSVDLVIAIKTDAELNKSTELWKFAALHHAGSDFGQYAILKSPTLTFGQDTRDLCSTSFSILESDIIRDSPICIKMAYVMIKNCLLGEISSEIHKFMLKTSLLQLIVRGKFCNVTDADTLSATAVLECAQIYLRHVWRYVLDDAVGSIDRPGHYLPIFHFEPFARFSKLFLRQFGQNFSSSHVEDIGALDEASTRINTLAQRIEKSYDELKTLCAYFGVAATEDFGRFMTDDSDDQRFFTSVSPDQTESNRLLRYALMPTDEDDKVSEKVDVIDSISSPFEHTGVTLRYQLAKSRSPFKAEHLISLVSPLRYYAKEQEIIAQNSKVCELIHGGK